MNVALPRLLPSGLLLTAFPCLAITLHVDVNSTAPVSPYTNWATAANVIQDAVDAAVAGDTVLVTNGVYATGGKAVYGSMTNRVAVDKPLMLLSVNGPEFTIVQGGKAVGGGNGHGAIRCVYLTNGAMLSGFTLTNGGTLASGDLEREQSGGGLSCEPAGASVSNCVITGNSAVRGGGARGGTLTHCTLTGNWADLSGGGAAGGTLTGCSLTGNSAAGSGGGAHGCTLENCRVTDNHAADSGGGAHGGTMNNCTLAGNSSGMSGGGVFSGFHRNCIIFFNTAPSDGNYQYASLNSCCTTPLPAAGAGNITNAPLFVDTNGWADLRLQSNSPCINAGDNAYVTTAYDLDGNDRVVGATVDLGAYEYPSPASDISYVWLQQYGLPTDGSVDALDLDNDGATTWQEWKMWTVPTNSLSVMRMLKPQPQTNGTKVTWHSVNGHRYGLERSTEFTAPFTLLQGNIVGQTGTTSFTDTNSVASGPAFYRVGVWE